MRASPFWGTAALLVSACATHSAPETWLPTASRAPSHPYGAWTSVTMLGDSTFTAAFREYGTRWLYRHPTPRDFFSTVSQVAGHDLEWFWRSWYYETWRLDQALGFGRQTLAGGGEAGG